ncbi:MAG: NfeD family protein [Thermoplasmata archaeon]|nr:NfeD family protein [Euryarchaeota archaeon]RLF65220.1 MAG: NfeD family protein [Thermoplasmata archaeon]
MPTEYTSIIAWALIIIGILLIVAEMSIPGFFIAVPGTAMLIVGILVLVFPEILSTIWAPIIGVSVALGAMGISIYLYRRLAKPIGPPMTTSADSLIGKEGIVVKRIVPNSYSGKVKIGSDVWSATADEEIPEGERVQIKKVEGVHLYVERIK